jgi:hypothetical protein
MHMGKWSMDKEMKRLPTLPLEKYQKEIKN